MFGITRTLIGYLRSVGQKSCFGRGTDISLLKVNFFIFASLVINIPTAHSLHFYAWKNLVFYILAIDRGQQGSIFYKSKRVVEPAGKLNEKNV